MARVSRIMHRDCAGAQYWGRGGAGNYFIDKAQDSDGEAGEDQVLSRTSSSTESAKELAARGKKWMFGWRSSSVASVAK